MRALRSDAGYTLTELLVAMGLMLVIVSATLVVFEGSERTARKSRLQNEAQDQARLAIDRIARDLRNHATPVMTTSVNLPVAVLKAESQDIAFVAVGNSRPVGSMNTRNLHFARYCLNPTTRTLWWQRRTWTSASPPAVPSMSACPGTTGWTTSSPVADRITNGDRPIWSFGPVGYSGVDEIRTVNTDLYVDAEPAVAPAESRLGTGVFLRNQNRAPTAQMEARPLGDGHVLLIGSGSSDPEGQTLRFTWKDNGTVISCTSPVCDYKPPASGVRSFSLDVSDPSDLIGSAGPVSVTVQ